MRKATTLLMILASLFFYTVVLGGAASADPDAPGNNGTVKIVNDQGDGADDQDNDPHVCLFHIYGFHFDDSSKGTWHIEAWAPGGGPLTASQQDGTWTADGTGKFDARPTAQPFPNGHYKLFVKETFDPKRASATPGGDKQKVFWVKCGQASSTGSSTGESTGSSTGSSTGNATGSSSGSSTGETTGSSTGASTGSATGSSTGESSGSSTGSSTGSTTGSSTGTATGSSTGSSTTGSSTGSTTGSSTGTTSNSSNGTAVAGFQSAPSNTAVGTVSPIVETPQTGAVAGTQTSGVVAGVQNLPSTSTSAPAVPLAAIGLALMAIGGALLRRRDLRG